MNTVMDEKKDEKISSYVNAPLFEDPEQGSEDAVDYTKTSEYIVDAPDTQKLKALRDAEDAENGIEDLTQETEFSGGTGNAETQDQQKREAGKEMLLFLRDLVICALCVFLVVRYLYRPIEVIGNSMYPTLTDKSLGFSNLIGRNTQDIERFDIVIINIPEKNEYIVKRVIGMPGETVSYVSGQLYINGEAMAEDFFDEDYVSSYGQGAFMSNVDPITLGQDEYYCLGDNRPHSSDSRYYGPFKESQIISKGILILFPFSEFGVKTW